MRSFKPQQQRGAFTLVEILVVVVILGILAGIVLPKFANASADARKNTLLSTLHALRGQVELYMLQHGDTPPALSGSDWSGLTGQSVFNGTDCGPYVTLPPINPINRFSDILVVTSDVLGGDAVTTPGMGFVYNSTNGKLWATNTAADRVFNEVDPADPNN